MIIEQQQAAETNYNDNIETTTGCRELHTKHLCLPTSWTANRFYLIMSLRLNRGCRKPRQRMSPPIRWTKKTTSCPLRISPPIRNAKCLKQSSKNISSDKVHKTHDSKLSTKNVTTERCIRVWQQAFIFEYHLLGFSLHSKCRVKVNRAHCSLFSWFYHSASA